MLENIDYCPVLHTKNSEIKALLHLPVATKARIFPMVVARPWPNANQLQRTWDKIAEAFGGRRFALDLDRTRRGRPSTRPAAEQFNRLFDPAGGFRFYYEALGRIPNAIPVFRSRAADGPESFQAEIANVEQLDRGLVLRVEHEFAAGMPELVRSVHAAHRDFVLFVDAGWAPDLLTRFDWASAVIGSLPEDHETIEVVACGSSFPETFTDIQGRGEIQVLERSLYDQLVRRHNRVSLTYGDWASTRPPRESAPMTPIPRIDLAMSREWIAFRQTEAESYPDIARRVIADRSWPADLNIWGTYTIENTANELPGEIKSPATAAAVRVNVHMHRQANFGQAELVSDGDEPFTDD